jgi:Cof subfamily protein (haloacid dehalogenase superfamily)
MQTFKNCLLAADIDQTLVSNGKIVARNIEAIKRFREHGGTFVLATGRSATALGQVYRIMDKKLIGPSVVLNGAMIYDINKQEIVFANTLEDSSKTHVNFVMDNFSDVGIEVHSGTRVYVLNDTEATSFHGSYESLNQEHVTFEQIKNETWHKVLYVCDTEETREKLAEKVSSLDNNISSFVYTSLIFGEKQHLYYEQVPKGTTKAKGLLKLAEILNIKKGGLFAIGDYYNDLEMLKSADISASPSGAIEEVKQIVNYVGGPCEDGAVADFIEYLFNMEVKNGR